MSYPVIIRPEAEADLVEQFNWYEGRKQGLGYEFLTEVRSVLQQIEENPLRYARVYRDARRAFLPARGRPIPDDDLVDDDRDDGHDDDSDDHNYDGDHGNDSRLTRGRPAGAAGQLRSQAGRVSLRGARAAC